MLISDSRIIWKALNGLICVYKPAEVSSNQVRKTIISNICKELCEMETRPIEKYVKIEGATNSKMSVIVDDNYADHPLVVGQRYQPKDLRCTWATYLYNNSSGVMLYGINQGTKLANRIRLLRPVRAYRITGKFGEASDNYFKDGKIVERSTFHHIKKIYLDRMLYHSQAKNRKKMFELYGINLKDNTEQNIILQDEARPDDGKLPVLYTIKCIYLELPYFTIEVQCVNEYEMYLRALIHDIGMKMKSTAHCISIQCIRIGNFTVEDALLSKHWKLQDITENLLQTTKKYLEHERVVAAQQESLENRLY